MTNQKPVHPQAVWRVQGWQVVMREIVHANSGVRRFESELETRREEASLP